MTTAGILLNCIPRCGRVLEWMGVSLAVAGLSTVAVVFYCYVCLSLAQLQQLSPAEIIRGLS